MKATVAVYPQLTPTVNALLKGCLRQHRQSQQLFYEYFYAYGLSVCLRYTQNYTEAREVLNVAFTKILNKLQLYDKQQSLKAWMRRIMINTAIDHYRQSRRYGLQATIDEAMHLSVPDTAVDKLSYKEIIREVEALTPAYQAVFRLYAIEGYKHEEIARKLGISPGTSKSNLFRARSVLQSRLARLNRMEELARGKN